MAWRPEGRRRHAQANIFPQKRRYQAFKSRFEDGPGTNPEELIAAAHAACFSMALSAALSQKGHAPTRIHTKATVHFGPVTGGFAISRIELDTVGQVPGIDAVTFEQVAQAAKLAET